MDLIEIAEGEGINTFAVLQLVDVVATDDLIGLVREERLHHKGAQPFLTLDDIDQAHYTSMHASEADELYLPEDDEVTDWDTPGAESAYERRVLAHVAAQLRRPELQHDHRSLRRECAPESVAALVAANDDPMQVIDPAPQLLRVPVADPLATIAGLPNGSAVSAHADDSDDDSIDRMAITADLQPDGSLDVSLDFDFNFGDNSGHGPYVSLPERMAIPDNPDKWRSLPISDITAASDTAPAQVETENDGGALLIRVGDEDVDVEGVHNYRLNYTIGGVLNPEATGSGLDELNWNAIGTGWEIPLRDVSVTVTTPVAGSRYACFSGDDYSQECPVTPTADNRSVTYGPIAELPPGDGLQVVAGMPAGSFPGVQPILIERWSASRVLGLNPVSGGLGVLVAAVGAAIAVVLRRRQRDLEYAGAVPGQVPDDAAAAATRPYRKQPVAVQFSPPKDVRPAELDTLGSRRTTQAGVSATIIDLAARGHLRVEQTAGSDPSETGDAAGWRLRATGEPDGALRSWERTLLTELFTDGPVVELDSAGVLETASTRSRAELQREVAKESGWYRSDPGRTRTAWGLAGAGLLVLGIALVFALGFTLGLGLIGVAIALLGIAVAAMTTGLPGRSAAGTAVQVQADGFRTYLQTAEADQIRFEEGVDLFSRYLPYAMIWGLTARWTKVFGELARRRDDVPVPNWYVGLAPWSFDSAATDSFVQSMDGFTDAATTAMTAPSSGSGGGSGFSGGGGVGGGGGGGW